MRFFLSNFLVDFWGHEGFMYISNTPDTTAIRNILKGLRVIFRMTPAVLIAPWILVVLFGSTLSLLSF